MRAQLMYTVKKCGTVGGTYLKLPVYDVLLVPKFLYYLENSMLVLQNAFYFLTYIIML